MSKHFFIFSALFLLMIEGMAQSKDAIGINTKLPLSDLHVHGKLQVTNEFNLGGDAFTKGAEPKVGQLLMSKGPNKAAVWTSVNMPVVIPNQYTLTSSQIVLDKVGIETNESNNKRKYVYNELITTYEKDATWHQLPELVSKFTLKKPKYKINLTLQTVASIPFESTAIVNGETKRNLSYSFAIAIFIDDKLKTVKPFIVEGNYGAVASVTLMATVEDGLALDEEHTVKVAAIARKSNWVADAKGFLAIGRPNKGNLDLVPPFMATSSLKVEVYEVVVE